MASLEEYGCRIGPGDGLAAHFGDAAVVTPAWQHTKLAVLDEILAVTKTCGSQPAPGRTLCRQLAGLLAREEPGGVPTFVALAGAEDGLAVFVHGEVDAVVERSEGEEIVSGRHVATWVDRIVEEPIASIAVAPEGQGRPDLDARFDLRAGVVPAGSLLLTKHSLQPAEPVAPAAGVGTAVGGKQAVGNSGDKPVEPADVSSGQSLFPDAPDEEGRGAFRTIALRGIPLEEPRTPLPIGGRPAPADAGGAPSVGLLLFDDGTTFSLNSEVVVGREPDTDPRVVSGEAQPLVVTDSERSVSRLHLRVIVEGETVQIVDLRSANGTEVRPPGAPGWDQLTPGVATPIVSDTEVRLGNRTFTFDARRS